MPDNGINWKNRFGKSPDEMDEGEWRIAVSSLLMETCGHKPIIDRLEKLFYIIVVIWPFMLGALVWWFIEWVKTRGA